MVNWFVVARFGVPLSVAVTVTGNTPASVGVPEEVRVAPTKVMPAGIPDAV